MPSAALAPHAHGKGYATEALRTVLEWSDSHFGSSRTVCLIHPDNTPSIRVAIKLAYREHLRLDSTILFTRDAVRGRRRRCGRCGRGFRQ